MSYLTERPKRIQGIVPSSVSDQRVRSEMPRLWAASRGRSSNRGTPLTKVEHSSLKATVGAESRCSVMPQL